MSAHQLRGDVAERYNVAWPAVVFVASAGPASLALSCRAASAQHNAACEHPQRTYLDRALLADQNLGARERAVFHTLLPEVHQAR
jgi:hypothetical protein